MELSNELDYITGEATAIIEEKVKKAGGRVKLLDFNWDDGLPDEFYELPNGYYWNNRFGVTFVHPCKIYELWTDVDNVVVSAYDMEGDEFYNLHLNDLYVEVLIDIAERL